MTAGVWPPLVGVGLAAATVGALLPRPAYRLAVAWGEVPVAGCRHCSTVFGPGWWGWWAVGSRCAGCRGRIGPSVWLLAAGTAVAAVGLAWRFAGDLVMVPFLALAPLGVLLAAIDVACHRLPERLVLPAVGAAVGLFAGVAALTGAWTSWLRALAAALVFAGGHLVLALLPGGQLGGGDVTLAALLGVHLGWLGWPYLVVGAVLPWLLAAPAALILLARRAGGRSELAFGPAMLTGAYLSVVGLPVVGARLFG